MKKSISMLICSLLVATSVASATSVTALAAPKLNPYNTVQAETNFGSEGVEKTPEVYNDKKITVLNSVEAGDYWIVKDLEFSEGFSKLSLTARADEASLIEVRKDSVDGETLGNIKINTTNGEFKTFTGKMKNLEGMNTIVFVGVRGNASVDYWVAEKAETSVVNPDPDPVVTEEVDPYTKVEAENAVSRKFAAEITDNGTTFLAIRADGGYAVAKNVNFYQGIAAIELSVKASKAAVLELRLDSYDGDVLASYKINPSDSFVQTYTKADTSVTGTHDIYYVPTVSGTTVQFDSWKAIIAPVKPNPDDPDPVDPDDPIIVDPDPDPVEKGITTEYTLNNWGSGYQVQVKVTNESAQRVEGWTVKVNKDDVGIDASWNVNIKDDGNYYVITPVEWNSVIEAGKSVEFGFQGSSHVNDKIELFAVGEIKDDPVVEPDPDEPIIVDPDPVDPDPVDPDPVDPDEPIIIEPDDPVVNEDLALEYTINGQGSATINFKVVNNGKASVNGWTLRLKRSQITIDNFWCVKVAVVGDYYVITPESWNSVVNAGDGAYFGVQGSGVTGTTLDYTLE